MLTSKVVFADSFAGISGRASGWVELWGCGEFADWVVEEGGEVVLVMLRELELDLREWFVGWKREIEICGCVWISRNRGLRKSLVINCIGSNL